MAASVENNPQIRLSVSMLPSSRNIVFSDSSFFTRQTNVVQQLPTPAEVRARSPPVKRYSEPTRFPELQLLVKWGAEITHAEGQCMWAIRKLLPTSVPVPEVYGWCYDNDEVFIYMELKPGVTLKERWDELKTPDKEAVCEQLREIFAALRRLVQDPDDVFIGDISRKPLLDYIFPARCLASSGPFPTVAAFHDWFAALADVNNTGYYDPNRPGLPDDVPIVFTHADLHRANVIVSESSPIKVQALIDWTQSGWYPEYWEYCKAFHDAGIVGECEWATEYLPRILDAHECEEYWKWFGALVGYGNM
ncbi:kinase-like protein [Wilcoxina mikolae CBS 423.85]|nr:kinase-like protein [Wilcoxina mikolae CBS 423.85]